MEVARSVWLQGGICRCRVEFQQTPIELRLMSDLDSAQGVVHVAANVLGGLLTAKAAIACTVPIAQLDGFSAAPLTRPMAQMPRQLHRSSSGRSRPPSAARGCRGFPGQLNFGSAA